ncbi:MAG: Maf family protein [Mariprofundaceae bacterium]
MEVILASRSPRRLHLLRAAGLTVEVRVSGTDETREADEDVIALVRRLAVAKAATHLNAELPVIAADTLVVVDGEPIGQPRDRQQARDILKRLAGRAHEVITGVCVRFGEVRRTDVVSTTVRFRSMEEGEIETYLDHNNYLDKAGAYAIQDGAASFVEETRGPLDNVIGLPVKRTLEMLREVARA